MSARRFLVLQVRPEAEAAEEEFGALLSRGGLPADRVHRVRLDLAPLPPIDLDAYAGIIVGGGPGCVSDPPERKDPLQARMEADVAGLMPEILARDRPFLGCCYGLGILGRALGARVGKDRYAEEIGGVDCTLTREGARDPLLAGLPDRFRALVGHKEAVETVPEGAVHLVASAPCPVQMIRAGRNVYATQFHPEAGGESFAHRIRIYRDHGYFDPDDAVRLTAACLAEDVRVPQRIVARFVRRYGGD